MKYTAEILHFGDKTNQTAYLTSIFAPQRHLSYQLIASWANQPSRLDTDKINGLLLHRNQIGFNSKYLIYYRRDSYFSCMEFIGDILEPDSIDVQ